MSIMLMFLVLLGYKESSKKFDEPILPSFKSGIEAFSCYSCYLFRG